MFNHKHYVPVLKGKRAEFPALAALKSKKHITPLLEAVPSGESDDIPRRMAGKWPERTPYFIDFGYLDDPDDDVTPAPNDHPLIECFADVHDRGQSAIPVTALSRSQSYQDAVKQIASEHERGAALRLTSDDFEDGSDGLEELLEAFKSYVELDESEIDLIIDIGSIAGNSSGAVAQVHRAHIDLVPNLDDWRTLTVSSSAFPLSLAPLIRNQWNPENRSDWRAWRSLVTGARPPARLPAFGDYGIAHPDLPPEGRATILAQLRYATPDTWLIWKGFNVFTHADGFDQFYAICRDLITRQEFRGSAFSAGDDEIQSKATNADSPGNAETWRRIGTNHHIETVLEQIANLP